jgi:hypothetical protein
MRKGKRYCTHPNQNRHGQMYDWAVIMDPNIGVTMEAKARCNPNSDDALCNDQSSLDDWYEEDSHYKQKS